jgi:hypothetical protein
MICYKNKGIQQVNLFVLYNKVNLISLLIYKSYILNPNIILTYNKGSYIIL